MQQKGDFLTLRWKRLASVCEPHFLVHPQVKFVKIMSADFGGVDISWDEIFVMQ